MDTSSETFNNTVNKEDMENLDKCNLCDYAPGQAENLRTHMKTLPKAQWLHLNDFSPEWVFKWFLKVPA